MNQDNYYVKELMGILGADNIKIDVPMNKYTTFRVGGNADIMVTPQDYEQVKNVIKLCKENNINFIILGKGSNMLVKDRGIRGVVINLTKLNNIQITHNTVTADAGASFISVSLMCAKKGLTGLEFASGIPGSIGGAVAMNAGAYGGEIVDIIESAIVIDNNLDIITLKKDELNLSYRDSIILRKNYIVLQVTLKLKHGNIDEINSVINNLTARRKEKQPLEYASAGSTFKRPEGYYAAKLIQDSGLKGYHIGDAEVSEKHSGFIINKGSASALDILDLINHVQQTVLTKYNVKLETEVKIVGDD